MVDFPCTQSNSRDYEFVFKFISLQGSPGTRTTPSRGPPRPVDGRIGDEASFIVILLYSLIDKYFEDKDLPKEKEHLKQEEDNIIEFAKQLMKDPSSN